MRFLSNSKWCGACLALLVGAAVFAVYAPSVGYDFVPLDDDLYIRENTLVRDGISAVALKGALTETRENYWAPLLWMSYMLDVELFGMEPWGFHLTNVFLFALNAGLLCCLVRRWTGRTGVALAVSLLWAFHPARVESVAWITERKDVLSGLFFLLGLWFYTLGREAKSAVATDRDSPKPSAFRLQPSILVFLSWLCLVLGGMAKQVMIVMPAALMLLDIWPLERTNWNRMWRDGWRLAAEKWAFWVVAVALASLPIWFHHVQGAILEVSVRHRLAMIPIHYLFYFQKLAWPTQLMPLQAELPFRWWTWAMGLAILIGVTWGVWRHRTQHPWALMGWLWFVALLFPLSGVVWAGQERVATRFTYLPQIGLTLAVVLAVDGYFRRRGLSSRWGGGVCALVVFACLGQTFWLLPHWRNKEDFSEWVFKINSGNETACQLGGDWHLNRGEWAQAEEVYIRGTIMQNKRCFARLCRLGIWCGQVEGVNRIWQVYEETRKREVLNFTLVDTPEEIGLLWGIRGQILRATGDFDGAISALKEAVKLEKDPAAFVVAEFLRACHEAGRPEAGAEAAARLNAAKGLDVREWRDLLPAYLQLWQEGARGQAFDYFSEHARRYPADGMALNNMAWLLATAEPDGLNHARMDEWSARALDWAKQALELGGEKLPGAWDTMAAARANTKDFDGAIAAAEKAMALAKGAGDWMLLSKVQARVDGYRVGMPWREPDKRVEKAQARKSE